MLPLKECAKNMKVASLLQCQKKFLFWMMQAGLSSIAWSDITIYLLTPGNSSQLSAMVQVKRNWALSWTSGPTTNLTSSNTKKEKILKKKGYHCLKFQYILRHPKQVSNHRKCQDGIEKTLLHKNTELEIHPATPTPPPPKKTLTPWTPIKSKY